MNKIILKTLFSAMIMITGGYLFSADSEQTVFVISAKKGFVDLSDNKIAIIKKNIEIKEEDGKKHFVFNGKNSFIKITKTPALNLTHNFGIEMDIKLSSKPSTSYQRLFSHCLFKPRGGYDFAVRKGKLIFWNGGKKGWINSPLIVADNQWHKVGVKICRDKIIFNVDEKTIKLDCHSGLSCKSISAIGALSADIRQGYFIGKLRNLKVYKFKTEKTKSEEKFCMKKNLTDNSSTSQIKKSNTRSTTKSALKSLSSEIIVLPFPKQIKTSKTMFALSEKVCIVNNSSDTVAKYAANRLCQELISLVKIDAKVADKADPNASLIINLSIKKFRPEGYQIRSKKTKNKLIYTIEGNDPNGILYGTFTIRQVIHAASSNNGIPVSPESISIDDWPTMKTRLLPTEIYRFPKNDPRKKEKTERLDWSSFWRFNGFWIALNGTPSRSLAPATSDELTRLAALAKQRGMTLYGTLSFYGAIEERGIDDGMCPSNKKTLAYIRNFFERAAKAGCEGLSIQFDDITTETRNHHKRCAKCKSRFNSIAEWQLPFIRQMVEVAKANGIKKLIVTPTPYGRDVADRKIYKDYFKTLCTPDFMKDVLVFHCEILPEKVAHLKKLGLKNYIWYDNGLWPTPMYYEGNYMGISKLHHVWYGHHATPEDAVAPAPGIMNALRNLNDFCNHVYPSPTGSHISRAMGGCLAWTPKQTVDSQSFMRKRLIEMLYGRGSWNDYKIWEDNMTAWFASYRHDALNMDKDKAKLQLNTAQKALNQLNAINEAVKGLDAPLPFLRKESDKSLAQMQKTIVKAHDTLKTQALLPPLKNLENFPIPAGVKLCLSFDSFSGDRFFDSVDKERYGIFRGGVPVLKRGVINNAAFFNGKNNILAIPASTTQDLNPGKKSFSIECWVFMMGEWWNSFVDKRGCTRYIYRKPGWALGSDRQGNTWRFTMEDVKENYITLSFTSPDMLYKWHHLAAVRNKQEKMVYFYVDGILRDKKSDHTGDITNSMPLICGKDTMVGGGYWGLLDNITYLNRALSPNEVKKHATIKATRREK